MIKVKRVTQPGFDNTLAICNGRHFNSVLVDDDEVPALIAALARRAAPEPTDTDEQYERLQAALKAYAELDEADADVIDRAAAALHQLRSWRWIRTDNVTPGEWACSNCGATFDADERLLHTDGRSACPDCASGEVGAIEPEGSAEHPEPRGKAHIEFRPLLTPGGDYEYDGNAYAPGEYEAEYGAEALAEDLAASDQDGERFVREIDWTAEQCRLFNELARTYHTLVADALNAAKGGPTLAEAAATLAAAGCVPATQEEAREIAEIEAPPRRALDGALDSSYAIETEAEAMERDRKNLRMHEHPAAIETEDSPEDAAKRAERRANPACGHSACSQHYIDTGENVCVAEDENEPPA